MILIMDEKINEHKKFVESEIDTLTDSPNPSRVNLLLSYHDMMTRNFQHERQIHLYITLFFAGLMLVSWLSFSAVLVFGVVDLLLPVGLLTLILTVLEGFYISYYYRLENRIAKLYPLTDKIYQLQD